MGDNIPHHKKFNTELTDYSEVHKEKTGPYAPNLDLDVLVIGAGFGEPMPSPRPFVASPCC